MATEMEARIGSTTFAVCSDTSKVSCHSDVMMISVKEGTATLDVNSVRKVREEHKMSKRRATGNASSISSSSPRYSERPE